MKRALVVLCALPLLWLNSTGCSDSEEDGSGGGSGDRVATILALTGDPASGATQFGNTCGLGASCHNSDGTSSGNAPDLTTEAASLTDETIIDAVVGGRDGMPPVPESSLTDQQVADVAAYIRSEWGG